ncbi:MAG: hypothetical protein ACTSUE_15165, partial [Promethearchaeota archaeon]
MSSYPVAQHYFLREQGDWPVRKVDYGEVPCYPESQTFLVHLDQSLLTNTKQSLQDIDFSNPRAKTLYGVIMAAFHICANPVLGLTEMTEKTVMTDKLTSRYFTPRDGIQKGMRRIQCYLEIVREPLKDAHGQIKLHKGQEMGNGDVAALRYWFFAIDPDFSFDL